MKKLLIISTLLLATAADAGGWAWRVEAHSGSAYGYGIHTNYQAAKRIALRECAVRTPSWDACYVTGYSQDWYPQ